MALISYVSTRKKSHAEALKIAAETEQIRAVTTKLLLELDGQPDAIAGSRGAPRGWTASGSDPWDYDMGVDRAMCYSGHASGFIRSRPNPRGFATLMQNMRADNFLGQRLRMAAWVRAEGVGNWAGLWMRVNGSSGEMLSFDNMERRAIRGSAGWKRHEIVLDVPGNSEAIAFGVLLEGAGSVWIDDVRFEAVADSVETTDVMDHHEFSSEPVNLDFEDLTISEAGSPD